jgi:drug/metabolite transporter (DMT)-like permease
VYALIAAVIGYAVTDAMVKWLAARYPVLEITFFRSLLTFIPAAVIVWQEGISSLRTGQLLLHVFRAAFGSAAMLLAFFAYAALPLANVTALGQTYPLFLVGLSRLIAGDQVSFEEWIAVAIGFLGAIIIVQPGSSTFDWHYLLPLAGSFCLALFVLLIRFVSPTESRASLIVYVPFITAIWTGGSLEWVWVPPQLSDALLITAMGLLGGTAFYLRNLAYSTAKPSALAPIEYLGILFAALIGIIIFGNKPTWNIALGAMILVGSSYYIVRIQRKTK